jgi:hypothetical protein
MNRFLCVNFVKPVSVIIFDLDPIPVRLVIFYVISVIYEILVLTTWGARCKTHFVIMGPFCFRKMLDNIAQYYPFYHFAFIL